MKLKRKARVAEGPLRRIYESPQTPLSRVLASPQVSAATKAALRAERQGLNPFALKAEVERRLKKIESLRSGEGPTTVAVGALEQVLGELVHTRHGKVGGPPGQGAPTWPDRVPLGPQKKMTN